jgi:gonadotropin-releasing hormone receptor
LCVSGSERLFKAEIDTSSHVGSVRACAAPDLNRRRLMQRAKMKSLRISVVILVACSIWWAPYYVSMMYYMFISKVRHFSQSIFQHVFSRYLLMVVDRILCRGWDISSCCKS